MLSESQLHWLRENIKTAEHPNLFRDMERVAKDARILAKEKNKNEIICGGGK
jgi:hypothetical protein